MNIQGRTLPNVTWRDGNADTNFSWVFDTKLTKRYLLTFYNMDKRKYEVYGFDAIDNDEALKIALNYVDGKLIDHPVLVEINDKYALELQVK
jgi:hypothetical protein